MKLIKKKNNKEKRLMIISGGSGGHVFPGLSIAINMIKKGWKVKWLGVKNKIEGFLISKYGIDIDYIDVRGFRNKSLMSCSLSVLFFIKAMFQSFFIIRNWNPHIVIGMGGYVSGPACLLSWGLGIPLCIHEQNSVVGLANYLLSKFAVKIFVGYPTACVKNNCKYILVGNPVRSSLSSIPDPVIRLKNRRGPLRVLIIGGSQGSYFLNSIIPKIFFKLSKKFFFWHQVGKESKCLFENKYLISNYNSYKLSEFIYNIDVAYRWADIVISRSGAMTVSEISVVGLPAIFIPFAHSDCHQYFNALLLKNAGAAIVIKESQKTLYKIIDILSNLNRERLLIMAKKAKMVSVYDSVNQIYKEIENLIKY